MSYKYFLILASCSIFLFGSCKKEESISQPTSMKITQIDVVRYTEFNNGAGWDPTDGPDLTLQLKKESNIVWTSLIFIENPVYLNVQVFSMQPPFSFESPTSQYTLSLYDVDSQTTKEFMGEISFTPYDGTKNKPEVLLLDDGGDVAFKIYVEYIY